MRTKTGRSLPLICLTALFATLACTQHPQSPKPEDLSVRTTHVDHCRDGDTCRIRTADGLWFNVRLSGIDAPELRRNRQGRDQPFAVEARAALSQLAAGKTFLLRQTDLDRYNRPVVELITTDGTVINHLMIRQGLAKVYRGDAGQLDRAPYLAEEAAAKAARRGLWADRPTN